VKYKLTLSLLIALSLLLGITAYARDDAGFISEDVTFTNGDIILAGTLTLPDTPGPHPAAIVISGSAAQNRDGFTEGFLEGYEPLRFLAETLTPEGVAVLRYDERGVGESTGVNHTSTTADFATDVLAAFDYLASRDDIDTQQIGLIGHSEGSNIVAYAAARNEDVAFVVSLAGQAVSGYDLLVEQTVKGALSNGATQEEAEQELAYGLMEWDMVLNDDWEGLEAYTRERIAAFPEEYQPTPEELDKMLVQQEEYGKSWVRFFLEYNPADDWQRIDAPILAIFAERDVQVTVEQNFEPFVAALENGATSDYEVVTIENANHTFQPGVETGSLIEYYELEPEMMPELLTIVREWVLDQVEVA